MEVTVPVLTKSGDVGKRTIAADGFRRFGKKVLLREYVEMAEARKRTGTHAALTRSEVAGSTKKIYRQKGTGRARHGNDKAPQLRGGGMCFAKKPREFGWSMPKQARRAALEAAVRGKLEDDEVRLVEAFSFDRPRTKAFAGLLKQLEVDGTFLVVPNAHDAKIWQSCRNLPGALYRVVSDLNAYEVLKQKYLVIEADALKALEQRFSRG
ncbi:MAG TPA: 50S ribosomal protein L4 [Planctomycetota bacterium]|nr:50S ribosomal protein L4 [Planctomycetota bacterium]